MHLERQVAGLPLAAAAWLCARDGQSLAALRRPGYWCAHQQHRGPLVGVQGNLQASIRSDAPTSAVIPGRIHVPGATTAQWNGSIRLHRPCDSGAVFCVALTHPLPQHTNRFFSEPPTFCGRRQHDSCVHWLLSPSPIRNLEADDKQTEMRLLI